MGLIKWLLANPEPIRYPGIGTPLVKLKPDTLIKTPEDVRLVIEMARRRS